MSALRGDYTSCSVIIYDVVGNHLGTTTATGYDKGSLRLRVREVPGILNLGDVCKLLILTAPSPCEFNGRIVRENLTEMIALFQGHEKEERGAVRYKVNYPALIENLVYDSKAFPLLEPLVVEMLNVSKSGVRFRAPINALSDNDRFQMRIKINENEKVLIADVVNHFDQESGMTDYGCRFLISN